MKIVDVWRVSRWDGGDRHNFAFFLSTKEEADKYKANNTFDDVSPQQIVIFDSVEEQKAFANKEMARRVYDRLTTEERLAIGLKERP